MSRINYDITANNKDFIRKMAEVQNEINRTSGFADAASNALSKIGAAVGITFGVAQVKAFAQEIVNVRGEMEALQTSFNVLAGEKGTSLFKDIKQFAADTTLEMPTLAKGAQTLLAFNISAEKVMPLLRQIGDISMGDAGKFQSLTLAFAQMSSTGKLMGQDLLQMINAGFNPLTVIAEKTGKNVAQLKEEMSEGAISAEMVAEAFAIATSEGGKFNGMLAKQGEGINGLKNQLSGAIQVTLNELGEKSEDIIKGSLKLATSLVHNYEKVGKVLMDIVALYGSYKAAVIATVAVENIAAASKAGWTLAEMAHFKALVLVEKAQKTLNATILKNPYVAVGAAVAALVFGIYKLVTAKTAEEKAVDRANKKWDDWQKKMDNAKSTVAELAGIFNSDSSTDIEKAEAWERIVNAFKELDGVTIPSLSEWLSFGEDDQAKLLSQIEEQGLLTKRNNAQQRYDKASKQLEVAEKTGRAKGYIIGLRREVTEAKAELDVAQKAYDDYMNLKDIAAQIANNPPKKEDTSFIPSNLEKVVKEVVKAEEKLSKAREKFSKSGTANNQKAVKEAEKNLADLQAIYKDMTGHSWVTIDTEEITKDFWPDLQRAIEQDAKGKEGVKVKVKFDVDESELLADEENRHKMEMEARAEYMREFGSIEEKKAEIITHYEGEIAKAASEAEKQLLKAKMAAELFDLEVKGLGKAQQAAQYVSELALAFQALGEAVGDKALSDIGEALGELASSAANILGAVATGNPVIIAITAVVEVVNLVAKAIEKQNQKLQEGAQLVQDQMNAYEEYYSKIIDGATKATDAINAYNEALKKTQKAESNARNSLRKAGYGDLANMNGQDLEKWMADNLGKYENLPEYVKTNIATIIDAEANAQDLADQLSEKLTGISFDGVKDGIRSALLDGTRSITDQVEDMMRTAIVNSITEAFSEDWAEWYANFNKAMEDGALSEEEAANLKAQAEAIYELQAAQSEAAMSAAGVLDKQRSANAQAVTQASQDSIDYMNGQLTLGNHTLLSIDTRLLDVNTSLSKLVQGASLSQTYLSNISRNSESLPLIFDSMEMIRTAIDSMNRNGVKIKA